MADILQLADIHKTYRTGAEELHVLTGINLTVKAGEKVAIIGQSGSGKSTLLHVAGLLDLPTSGSISVEGAEVKKMRDAALARIRAETFGFVYQQHFLMNDFTALENVQMPALIKGGSNEKRAQELLERVGLGERLNHHPGQLSGGEQQRVAIARALMNKPKLLFADEPTGNLDPETGAQVSDLFDQLVKEEGMACVMVTHNPALASTCERVLTLTKGVLANS